MSFYEILFRGYRFLSQNIEQLKIKFGIFPRQSYIVKSGQPWINESSDIILSEWKRHFRLDLNKLDQILANRIDFFGAETLDVGTPVNWRKDPLTGVKVPLIFGKKINYRNDKIVGNVKYLWELGRHQHLVPLAVGYLVSNDNKYKTAIANQIDIWIDSNPYAMGIHWCSALELSLRLISWSFIHNLLTLSGNKEGLFGIVESRKKLATAIYLQTRFIMSYLSRHSSANNHLIGELTGVWVVCQTFDLGQKGKKWASQTHGELENEMKHQVFSDGVNKEQALYYHLWVLDYFLLAWLIGEKTKRSFSNEFCEKIKKMAIFLQEVTPNNGVPPQIGDSDDGFVIRFEPEWIEKPYEDILSATNSIFKVGLKNAKFSQKAFWYSLIIDNYKSENNLSSHVNNDIHFPKQFLHGGYTILGNDRIKLVFDSGNLGYLSIAAHGHADALSICLAIDKDWWIIDPGTYSYHSESKWRNYFKGTRAHNTIEIDNQDQSLNCGAFLWLKHAKAELIDCGVKENTQYVVGIHNGYKDQKVRHERKITLNTIDNSINVIDKLTGVNTHNIKLHFHFAPFLDITKLKEDSGFSVNYREKSKILNVITDKQLNWALLKGSEDPILGWYSSSLGLKEPCFTLEGNATLKLPLIINNSFLIQ